jgi:uncharacterized protein (TIGR02147 family)
MSFVNLRHQDILRNELDARKILNKKYSLRSFASYLSVSPSFLSLVLSKKRNLSLAQGLSIIEQLKWSKELKLHFLSDIKNGGTTEDYSHSTDSRSKFNLGLAALQKFQSKKEVSVENFSVLSEWWIPVVLEILPILGSNASLSEIAKRVKVPKSQISAALNTLCILGYAKSEKGIFERCGTELLEVKPIPSAHIKKYQKQLLNQAYSSIDDYGVLEREITSILIPISKAKFELVRSKIRSFRDEMALIAQDESAQRVCALCIQLFPLTSANDS